MSRRAFARRLTGITAVGALGLAMAAAGPALAAGQPATNPNTDGAATGDVDTGSVLVQLSKDPLATSTGAERSGNGKVDFNNSKTRNVRADLAKQRNELRQWLRKNAPKAKITGEYDVALNAVAIRLNGTPISVLQGGPGVVSVEYQGVYTPTDMDDPDLSLISAFQGWEDAGATTVAGEPETWAGYGIQVGVIDSGIDQDHLCFYDLGESFPEPDRRLDEGDSRFTNNKVIVAKVFNNKINQGQYTPEAVDSHGTHVAGTIACNLETGPVTVQGAKIPYFPSGVAPGAQLGNYNVFPGDVASARSEDILNALQAAYEDGMDVINMSLGGGSSGKQDLLTIAVDNLDRAGVVVAVSAGNEGPGYMTIGSPGMAERALTAGASSVGHVVALDLVIGNESWPAAIGDFPVPTSDLRAELSVVLDALDYHQHDDTEELGFACDTVTESLNDTIALVSRGGCTFETKVANAQTAGALAVIVANNIPGDGPIVMAGSGTIPAVGVSYEDGQVLMGHDGDEITFEAPTYRDDLPNNVLESFSSVGPTDVEFRVKPDVVAPGGNVLSSIPGGGWAFYSGTSMASPHLAGMAAVVLDAHPTWEAWQVRSAIINTATADGVMQTAANTSAETDVRKVGAGLANLEAAVNATLLLSQPSISFGMVPSGSGKPLAHTIEVTDVSGEGIEVDVQGDAGFDASVDGDSVTVTFDAKTAAPGFYQAHLWLDEDTHAVLFAYVK